MTSCIIPKSKIEEVHIALSEYGGKKLVDIRSFMSFDGDEMKPTKKGVSLPIEKIDDIITGLTRIRNDATKLGWLK